MMQKIFVFTIGVFLTSCNINVLEQHQQIQANFKKQEDCWNRGDHECYMEAYLRSTDIQTISRAGVTKGYLAILTDYQKYFPPEKMGRLFFDELDVRLLSREYAYVVGRFNLKFPDQSELRQGWFSVLMQKQDGKWWMISDHSS